MSRNILTRGLRNKQAIYLFLQLFSQFNFHLLIIFRNLCCQTFSINDHLRWKHSYAKCISHVCVGENKSKANDVLITATDIMFSQIKIEDDFDERMDENPLKIVE